jgi:hypothetical protein
MNPFPAERKKWCLLIVQARTCVSAAIGWLVATSKPCHIHHGEKKRREREISRHPISDHASGEIKTSPQ